MNIFFITSSSNASGGGRQALYLASGMQHRGHSVRFFSLPHSTLRPLAPDIAWLDLPARPGQWKAALENAMPCATPVVVHAFHNKAVKVLAWSGTLWRLAGRPVACVVHRGVIFPPRNFLPYLVPGIRCFAVNSQACLNALPLLWRKNAGRVVYNCIPASKTTPTRPPQEVRADLAVSPEHTIIGCVSNNSSVKGQEVLLRAFAQCRPPRVILCLVGGQEERWGSLCAELGITDRVRLIPYTEKVADYLQLFSLFVLPSLSESSPNTLLEAMRMGLPALCSKVGGVPECILDSRFLVPPGNISALADALASLLANPGLLRKAAKDNLAFSSRFDVERKLDVMEKIYEELLLPFAR